MLLFEDHRSESTTVNHNSVVYTVAFSPDGSTLATGAKDGSVFLRDSNGHACLLRDRGAKCLPAHAIAYLPGECGVITGGVFGWSCWKRGSEGWDESGIQTERPVTSLAVVNERTVAFGIGNRLKNDLGTLELWDTSAGRKLPNYFLEPNGVRSVAACPAKKIVAWTTGHRKAKVWDITSSTKPFEFPQPAPCPSVALTEDGRAMAVAVDWTAKIYDLEKRRERVVLKGHKGAVAAVAFSPDGRTLMTGSWDQTIRLWDVATGLERANYNWDIGRVYCVTYAPDGLRLAAGGDLGRVVVWDAE